MKSDSNHDFQTAAAASPHQDTEDQAVAAESEVRPDAVNRARELIANANYPDAAVIQKTAGHLANHLQLPPAEK